MTKSEAKQKYLFLNTIREIILNDSDCLKDYIKPMRDLLIQQSSNEEESIRSIVAESLGRLFAAYPDQLMQTVTQGLQTGDVKQKATIAKSVKYSGQKAGSQSTQQIYRAVATDLIKLRTETDPEIKKNAIEGLTTIAHANWLIMQDQLTGL